MLPSRTMGLFVRSGAKPRAWTQIRTGHNNNKFETPEIMAIFSADGMITHFPEDSPQPARFWINHQRWEENRKSGSDNTTF